MRKCQGVPRDTSEDYANAKGEKHGHNDADGPAISARIDRLPVSREIWGIMLLAGVAWLVESYDVGVIGSVLPSLQKEFQLGAFSVGLLAIASTLGIVIGVIPAGWMADTIGRKKILITGTAWYTMDVLPRRKDYVSYVSPHSAVWEMVFQNILKRPNLYLF